MSRLRKDVEALTLNKQKPKDYDPEDEPLRDRDDENSDSGAEDHDVLDGREHYEKVGMSKLRKPESLPLDAKYDGVAVSRSAVNRGESDDDLLAMQDEDEDEDNDPFAETLDDRFPDGKRPLDDVDSERSSEFEASDDDDDEEEDLESITKKGDVGSDEIGDESDDDDEDDDDDDDDEQDDNSDTDGDQLSEQRPVSSKRQEAAGLLAKQSQTQTAGLAGAAGADVKKGQAVKKQYQTFDRLLDARIKFQKGLTAADDIFSQDEHATFAADAEEALQRAKHAAMQLFNTISSFRDSIVSTTPSVATARKRKRAIDIEDPTDLNATWGVLADLEEECLNARRLTIDKWSSRARASDPTNAASIAKSRFLDSSSQNRQLTAVLETFIINEQDKHLHDKTSMETANGQHKESLTLPHYDDSVFYQSLLRDLIASRSALSSAANNVPAAVLPPKLHPSGNKQNKKNVDTKASKGRKIRYTVHEKLQNFMAAEGDAGRDTAMWTERGKNEFFGSLFGQDRALREESDSDVAGDENLNGAELDALRLFRS